METTHLTPLSQHSAGTQPLRPVAVFLSLAAILLLLAGGAFVGSKTIAPHQAAARSATCRVTQVTLHGTGAPTTSCLDGKKTTVRTLPGGGKGPLAHLASTTSNCDDDALVLYWNAFPPGFIGNTGPMLCVNGSGVLNLTLYFAGLYWNDEVSAFWTGCYSDFFYQNINRGGATAYADGAPDGEYYSVYGNFAYQNVGNDQLSSVWQVNSLGGDDCLS